MGIGRAHHTSQGAAALVAGIPAAMRDSDSDDEPMTAPDVHAITKRDDGDHILEIDVV
jgi:hypothetical protein